MPSKQAVEHAKQDKKAGKAPSTQAGEFVKDEIHRIRAGAHGAKSTQQAIAIGLSEARRAGVKVKAPKQGTVSESTRKKAAHDSAVGQSHGKKASASTESSAKRARTSEAVLKRDSGTAASHEALSAHARQSAGKRTAGDRSAAAKQGAETKGAAARSAAARKGARTRAANRSTGGHAAHAH